MKAHSTQCEWSVINTRSQTISWIAHCSGKGKGKGKRGFV